MLANFEKENILINQTSGPEATKIFTTCLTGIWNVS